MIAFSDLIDAKNRIKPHIHRTPILTSTSINNFAKANLFFKPENFQKIGAFKYRGATNAIMLLDEESKKNGVTTHSSGNHGQAIAKAAQERNIPAYIVMPENAPQVKIDAVKGYGAEVVLCPPTLEARETFMQSVIDKTGATPIHPYNHPHVIAGQSTVAQEIIEDISNLDHIICPVGGGGLLSGTLLAIKNIAPHVKVIAAEPMGADDAYQSWKSETFIPQTNPNTVADGLLTSLGDITYPIIQENIHEIIRVEDANIIAAMKLIWERMKIVVEPSAAIGLAVALQNTEMFENTNTAIILTGGNVDLSKALKLMG